MYNIIGDIAGNYNTLKALLNKMPSGEVISLGDMVDRGPRGKEVLELFMVQGKALLGNHEHLLLDLYYQENKSNYRPYYMQGVWLANGGNTTIESFDVKAIEQLGEDSYRLLKPLNKIIPIEYINYLEQLPLYFKDKNLFLSHAPKPRHKTLDQALQLGSGFSSFYADQKSDTSLIWNRADPGPFEQYLQIFGHNAYKEPRFYSSSFKNGTRINLLKDEKNKSKLYAIGIDTSSAKVLTGIHYPSMEIYSQEYID